MMRTNMCMFVRFARIRLRGPCERECTATQARVFDRDHHSSDSSLLLKNFPLVQARFCTQPIRYLIRLLSLAVRKQWLVLLRLRIREAPIRKQVTPSAQLKLLARARPETNNAEEIVWTSIRGAVTLPVRPVSTLPLRAGDHLLGCLAQQLRWFRSVC